MMIEDAIKRDNSKVMQKSAEDQAGPHGNTFSYDQASIMAGFASMRTRIVCSLAAVLGLAGSVQLFGQEQAGFDQIDQAPLDLQFRVAATSIRQDSDKIARVRTMSKSKAGKRRPIADLQQGQGVLVGQWLFDEPGNGQSESKVSSIVKHSATKAETNQLAKSDKPRDLTCDLDLCLQVSQDPNNSKLWQLNPERILFDQKHKHAKLDFAFKVQESFEPLIFVRDPDIVSWDGNKHLLHGQNPGQTEVYLVNQTQMLIIPVTVDEAGWGQPDQKKIPGDLLIAQDLLRLSSGETEVGAQLELHPQAISTSTGGDGTLESAERFAGGKLQVTVAGHDNPSLSQFEVYAKPPAVATTNVEVQLIDERSNREEEQLYPLSDVNIRVLGSRYQASTDVKGQWTVKGMPADSSFVSTAEDPEGRILPHSYPIYTDSVLGGKQSKTLRALSYEQFSLRTQVFQVAQESGLASMCVRLLERDGSQAMANISAQINRNADGPYYFSNGFPSPGASETGVDGQLCYFNVTSGLVELSLYDGEQLLTAVTLPLIAGHHLEDDLYLWNGESFNIRLAAYPTATEQLYSVESYLTLRDVDFSEVIAVGENIEIDYVQDGVLRWPDVPSHYQGHYYALSEGAEFEPVLYALDTKPRPDYRSVLPLFPRGFTQDLYQELYVSESEMAGAFEPSLGHLLVYYQLTASVDAASLRFKLFDEYGRSVSDGWYFGSGHDGFVKGVFFNLDAGMYQLVIEDASGAWLETQTVALDYWTTTYAQLGARSVEALRSKE